MRQLQSLKNSGRRRRPDSRKPQLKLLGLSNRKHRETSLTKQIKKSKRCLKRNAPAKIVCLQNLTIKLPRLHTRLPAVHSKLSLAKPSLAHEFSERTHGHTSVASRDRSCTICPSQPYRGQRFASRKEFSQCNTQGKFSQQEC